MSKNEFALTVRGLSGWDEQDDNLDIDVTLPNGRSYNAAVFTVKNIQTIMDRYRKSGECSKGTYFWSANMIIAKDLKMKTLEETVRGLILDGGFNHVFSPNI